MGRDLTITAVIPAFNAAATIRRAIDSVLTQSAPPESTIVVDDGSTDGTADLANEYGSSVSVLTQANAGVSAARNLGLAACKTAFVAFLDADDEWLPGKLAQQRRILSEHPAVRWCFTHMDEVRDGKLANVPFPPDLDARLIDQPVLPFFQAAERGLSTGTCGAVLDILVVQAAGGFNPARRIAEDRDLWWRIARQHPEIGYCRDVTWLYHVDTPGSLTKESSDRSDSLRVVCEHWHWWRGQRRADFERYARLLARDYLVRSAAGEIRIDSAAQADAEALLDLKAVERGVLAAIRRLPPKAAQRLLAAVRLLPEAALRRLAAS